MSSRNISGRILKVNEFSYHTILFLVLTICVTANSAFAQPQHLTDAVTLATQLRQQGEQGIFTGADGKELNRYGGTWTGAEQSFITFADRPCP